MKYKDDLNNLVSKFEKYNDGVYDRDEFDEFIIGDIDQLDIDLIVKNGNKKIQLILDLSKKMIA